MLFSIIIPCYNSEKTIVSTLSSCVRQTYKEFEIIIIDDCSRDQTVPLIKDFFKKLSIDVRIKILVNSVNKGVSMSRNIGWDNAVGDYICFLDSDDIWHTEKLECIKNILLNTDVQVLCHKHNIKGDGADVQVCSDKYKVNMLSFLIRNQAQTSCFIVSNKINERFNWKMKYSEDYELWLRLCDKYDIYKLNAILTSLGRFPGTFGGLSSNRLSMRLGEAIAYINLAKQNSIYLPLLPLMFCYSILKLFKYELKFFIRKFFTKV